MHHSTVITLMFLMFGQLLILTFGGFILWLAGAFGTPPKFLNGRHRTDQAATTPAADTLEADTQSQASSH